MSKFYYKVAGTNGVFNPGVVESADKTKATNLLNNTYGVDPENSNGTVVVEFITQKEYNAIAEEKGEGLVHRVGA